MAAEQKSEANDDYDIGRGQPSRARKAHHRANQQTQANQTATPQGQELASTPDINAYLIQQHKIVQMEEDFLSKMRNLTPQQSLSRQLFNKSRARSSNCSLYGFRAQSMSKQDETRWLEMCPKCMLFMLSFLKMSECVPKWSQVSKSVIIIDLLSFWSYKIEISN